MSPSLSLRAWRCTKMTGTRFQNTLAAAHRMSASCTSCDCPSKTLIWRTTPPPWDHLPTSRYLSAKQETRSWAQWPSWLLLWTHVWRQLQPNLLWVRSCSLLLFSMSIMAKHEWSGFFKSLISCKPILRHYMESLLDSSFLRGVLSYEGGGPCSSCWGSCAAGRGGSEGQWTTGPPVWPGG